MCARQAEDAVLLERASMSRLTYEAADTSSWGDVQAWLPIRGCWGRPSTPAWGP